jgi:hypothetical protein
MTSVNVSTRMLSTPNSASSGARTVARMVPRTRMPNWIATSISPEAMRSPSEAGGSSRATASPVTSWSMSAYDAALLVREMGAATERAYFVPPWARVRSP